MAGRTGDLRREHVAFDAPGTTNDGAGGVVGAFGERFRRRAGFTRLRGGEVVLAARLEGRQPTVIRVRRDADTLMVTTDWRIRNLRGGHFDAAGNWLGEAFNVRSIIETDDRLWLDITAESGVAT